jgi:uncharacterized membrane protein
LERRSRFSTFELSLLALFSALIVAAKIGLRFPIRVPGHSGVFWMALAVVALGIVPKLGAGSIVGLTSALLAVFLGLGDQGAVYTLFSYLVLGVVSDLVARFLGGVHKPVPATLVGAVGNASKMLVKTLMASLLGIPGGFLAVGLLYSFATNLAMGAIGGFLGYLILEALRKAGFFAYLEEKR